MLNGIFIFLVLFSVLLAAVNGNMQALTDGILKDSRVAVDIALKLIGVMAFFLGLMKVGEQAGLLRLVARAVAPVMRRLFPSVPPEHPAMSAMIMNIASNMLGLGNAATPFGIKAMEELDKLNGEKGTATNAMVLFLAINTAGLALLPTGVVGLREAAGSANAMGIAIPTWFASGTATLVGITAAFLLSRLPAYRATEPPVLAPAEVADADGAASAVTDLPTEPAAITWRRIALWVFWAVFLVLMARSLADWASETAGRFSGVSMAALPAAAVATLMALIKIVTPWLIPAIVGGMVLYGWSRGVRVYEALVEGAKEGFQVAIRIIPYLVAIVVAVGMFRASGGMAQLVLLLGRFTNPLGLPPEALPMALIRPLSGSGALGVMVDAMKTHGPDSLIGYLVSTFQGSTETTFYVLAVYFGAVGVKRTRHALPACLMADAAGITAAVITVNLLFG